MSQLSPRPIEKKSKITNKKIPVNTTLHKIKTKSSITTKTSSNVAIKIGVSNLTLLKINQQTALNTVQNPINTFNAAALASSHQLHQETSLVSVPFIPKLDTEPILAVDKSKVKTTLRQEQSAKSLAVIKRKRRGLRKNPQSAPIDNAKKTADTTAEIFEADDKEPMLRTDVEVFQGKIVFNSDGNAFIIATESSTDSVANATLEQRTAGSVTATANEIDGGVTSSRSLTPAATAKALPLGDASSTATLKEASCNRGIKQASWLTSSTSPRIHSFRIVSAQDATAAISTNRSAFVKSSVEQTKFGTFSEHQQLQQEQQSQSKNTDTNDIDNESDNDNDNENDSTSSNSNIVQRSSKIQKPILMCFICKLSFGNTKTFSLHANCEHQLTLHPKERNLLNREYSSAIIQPPNMDECPQISFLEPIEMLKAIRNDDLNSETDVQKIDEDSTMQQSSTCKLRSARNTAVPDRYTAENVINEKSDEIEAITDVTILNSTLILPSTAGSFSLSPDLPKSTPTSPKSVVSSASTAQHSTLSSSVTDCISNSHLLLATSLSECIREQQMNEAGDVMVNNAVTATNTKFDNKILKQQQKSQEYNTTDIVETDVIGPFKLKDVIVSPSLISSLIPKSKSENISKGGYTAFHMSDSMTTTDADFIEDATISEKSRQKVCRTLLTTHAVNSNIGVSYSGECPRPSSLTTVSKTENDLLDVSSVTANTPITVADILQMQRSSLMTSFAEPSTSVPASTATTTVDDNKLEKSDASSCTKNFLQQQQQQCVTMCGSNLTTPQAALMSIAPTRNHLSYLHDSLAVLSDNYGNTNSGTTEVQKTSAKLFSDFLQQQLNLKNQQQRSQDFEYKGTDCKSCDMPSSPFCSTSHMLTINTTQQRSPTRSSSSCSAVLQTTANLTSSSPTNSAAVNVSAAAMAAAVVVSQQQQQNAAAAVAVAAAAAAASAANNTSSFTIGACSEHINGRPLGVECTRCEMILNSTRLNTGVQMSTRNSCKTLKCPQCNWHYKYQETLEIHMREKHPDGESACGYCLSGQQHPRLARGESYSCGYKPYRCEICNYSTTTKGNLSIHMQSDKHLNNMQELNSSQSMLAAAVAAASGGKTDVPSKMLLPNNIAASQQQQPTLSQSQTQQAQSGLSTTNSTISGNNGDSSSSVSGRAILDSFGNTASMLHKNKPSFRCDICSYETSVARNLRIHMTSEKHTHNMAALQSNIKHIQAYSFLHQHQQAVAAQHQQQLTVATQAAGLGSGLVTASFLPEIALADLAYNQAIMIQLLQHNSTSVGQQHQLHESVSEIQTSPRSSPRSSPRARHIEQQSTLQQQQQKIQLQQQQLQQLRQHLQKSCSPNNSSPTLLLPSAPYSNSELNLSSNFDGGGVGVSRADETLELPIRVDPFPIKLYSCLICDVFSSNSLDELNQHLLTDRSRSSNSIVAANNIDGNTKSSVSNSPSNDVMVTLNNNYICRLCNYKTNLKANFQLHSKTDKHLQKLNYVNHIREGGPDNEYKFKYLQLAANTVKLKCNCCDFYTNSIQKLSLHTKHMRHETMHMIFQHLLRIMQQHNIDKSETEWQQKQRQNQQSYLHPKVTHLETDGVTFDENSVTEASLNITSKAMSESLEQSLTCQLCSYSTSTLLNMIQHVKSMRHTQIEQFVSLQRHSEQLDPPSLDDIFKVVEQPIIPSLNLTAASTPQEDYAWCDVREATGWGRISSRLRCTHC
ncbi:zinc finger protein 2-like [Ceratitis capitata]|uniref:zinc finger protein 2-like n=1 Tax=Ceratitis capitata TaxID=7213 RepID=UPI000C6C728E|nr:zinc finger protein 2-like [Ceratitis capitata]